MCHPQADLNRSCLVHSTVPSFVDRHHQSLFNSLRNTNTSISLRLICCSSSHQTIRPPLSPAHRIVSRRQLAYLPRRLLEPILTVTILSIQSYVSSRPEPPATTQCAPPTCLRDHLCDRSSHDTAQSVAKEHLESRATEHGRYSSRPKAEQQCQACAAWRGSRWKGVLRKPSSSPISPTPSMTSIKRLLQLCGCTVYFYIPYCHITRSRRGVHDLRYFKTTC